MSANYTYGNYYGDSPGGGGLTSAFPLLKVADDPRFEGAMTKIVYTYRGNFCTKAEKPQTPPYTNAPLDYFYARAEAIAAEKSADTNLSVSALKINCFLGTRVETSGLGGVRQFSYGHSVSRSNYGALGYQLVQLTDFAIGSSSGAPFESQNYDIDPRQVWDGRGNMTELITTAGDDSGEPGEIHYADGSVHTYNRVNPGSSEAQDFSRVHNPYNHWLL